MRGTCGGDKITKLKIGRKKIKFQNTYNRLRAGPVVLNGLACSLGNCNFVELPSICLKGTFLLNMSKESNSTKEC